MNIIKREHEGKTEFVMSYQDNNFIVHYAGCDLYWTMIDYKKDNQFIVTKEDSIFYFLLDNLFNKLVDFNLLNGNCFTWSSEAYGIKENNNKLIISKLNEEYIIQFYQNPNKQFQRKDMCAICFCLSGSSYQEIANYFSFMFHNLNNNIKIKNKILQK